MESAPILNIWTALLKQLHKRAAWAVQNIKIVYKYPALLICLVNIPTCDTLIIITIIIIRQKLSEAAQFIDDKSPYYKYTAANVMGNENVKL